MKNRIIRSREIKERHLTIIIQTNNQDNAEDIKRELLTAIHKMNRRKEHKVSFEIFKNIRRT